MDEEYEDLMRLGLHDPKETEETIHDHAWFKSFINQVCKVCYIVKGGDEKRWITGLVADVITPNNELAPGTMRIKYYSKKREDFSELALSTFGIFDVVPMKKHEQLYYKLKHNIR